MWRLLALVLLTGIGAVVRVGVFDVQTIDYKTRRHLLAASILAVNDFNGPSLRAEMSLIRTDTSVLTLIDRMNQLESVNALIGPPLTQMTEWTHDIAVEFKTPALFYGSNHPQFSDLNYYSNFVRISSSSVMQGRALVELINRHYKWRYIVLLTTHSAYWRAVTFEFTSAASDLHLHVHEYTPLADGVEGLSNRMNDIRKSNHRIYVLLMDESDAAVVLQEASAVGLLGRGSQILGPESLTSQSMLQQLRNNGVDEEIMKGYIGLQLTVPVSQDVGVSFVESWRAQPATMNVSEDGSIWCSNATDADGNYLYIDSSAPNSCAGLNFSSFAEDGSDIAALALLAYDATYTLLTSMEHVENNSVIVNRSSVFQYIVSHEYSGVSGVIAFDNSLASINYSVGDRSTDIYYNVMNYYNGGFRRIGKWHSEMGYSVCSGDNCYSPVYNTGDNSPPSDLNDPETIHMSLFRRVLLLVFGAVGIAGGIVYAAIVFIHRQTLLIKISQPALIGLNIVGCTLGCLRAISAALPLDDALCTADLWLGNLSFAIVAGTLLMKTWRVHRVMNSGMKRIKITTNEVVLRTLGVALIIVLELAVWCFIEPPSMVLETVNMHENQLQRKCEARETQAGTIIATIVVLSQFVLLALGVWYTYLTRRIPSGINDSFKTGQVILSLVGISTAGLIVIYAVDLDPLDRQFIIAILFLVAVYRCLYLLFADRVYYLFLGYELDSNFMLSKRSPSSKSLFAAISRQMSRQTSRAGADARPQRGARRQLPSADDSVSISTKRLDLAAVAVEKKAYTPDELEQQMILCKAKIAKYQCRLMEIQEIAVNQNYIFNYAVSENSNDENEDTDEVVPKKVKTSVRVIPESEAEMLASEKSSISRVQSVEMQETRRQRSTKLPEGDLSLVEGCDDVESFRTLPARSLSARSNSVRPMSNATTEHENVIAAI